MESGKRARVLMMHIFDFFLAAFKINYYPVRSCSRTMKESPTTSLSVAVRWSTWPSSTMMIMRITHLRKRIEFSFCFSSFRMCDCFNSWLKCVWIVSIHKRRLSHLSFVLSTWNVWKRGKEREKEKDMSKRFRFDTRLKCELWHVIQSMSLNLQLKVK